MIAKHGAISNIRHRSCYYLRLVGLVLAEVCLHTKLKVHIFIRSENIDGFEIYNNGVIK